MTGKLRVFSDPPDDFSDKEKDAVERAREVFTGASDPSDESSFDQGKAIARADRNQLIANYCVLMAIDCGPRDPVIAAAFDRMTTEDIHQAMHAKSEEVRLSIVRDMAKDMPQGMRAILKSMPDELLENLSPPMKFLVQAIKNGDMDDMDDDGDTSSVEEIIDAAVEKASANIKLDRLEQMREEARSRGGGGYTGSISLNDLFAGHSLDDDDDNIN